MLGIGHTESNERKVLGAAASTSMVDRSTYRQSWSSDAPSSSSNSMGSTKESMSLWSKLRRQASRVHVGQASQTNSGGRLSLGAYQQGPVPYMDKRRASSSPHAAKPVVAGSMVSVQRPVTSQSARQQQQIGGAGSAMASWAADADDMSANNPPLSGVSSTRHQSLVPGLERLKTLTALGSDTNVSIIKRAERQQMRDPAGLDPSSSALPPTKSRSNSYLEPANAPPPSRIPAMTRVSTDVYRFSGTGSSGGKKTSLPAHSYSMDIPRTNPQRQQPQTQQQLQQQNQQRQHQRHQSFDHRNAENITAESIRQTLGEYTGKTSDVKGKPRLRRLMMFPGGSKQQSSPRNHIIELSLGGAGLERIAEDEEQHQHQLQKRAGAANAPAVAPPTAPRFDEPESVLPPADRAAASNHHSQSLQTRRVANIGQSYSQLLSAHHSHGAADSNSNMGGTALGGYRSDAKRFSENSGSTVSSGETLEMHAEYDSIVGSKPSLGIDRIPSITRPPSATPPKRPASAQVSQTQYHHQQQQQRLQRREPRLSLSNRPHLLERPKAIYNDGSNLIPSPTKEHPPSLVPIVHGRVGRGDDREHMLDPTVYRNTFFNARPLDEQKQLESSVLNKSGQLSLGETTRFLVRSASDDTLNSPGGHGGDSAAAEPLGNKVRFSGHLNYIPDYYLGPECGLGRNSSNDNAVGSGARADACAEQEDVSTFARERSFSSSMPSMASASSDGQHGLDGGADGLAGLSDLRRRPSEPTPSAGAGSSASARSKASPLPPPSRAAPTTMVKKSAHERSASSASNASVAEQEVEVLRRTIRILQSRNDMLSELVALNPLDAVPDHVKTHIRTIELENVWLHKELGRLRQSALRRAG
ncbi:hypothetical protein IWW48_004210 [Coemansia sp. RSA 1200]|nr:hypothetical protein IWW48_004210 [Coemansia sp. RSA 1200]